MSRNVTIDNTNTTAIQYYPPLCNGTGWDHNESELANYAVNNTYGWCSGSFNARATLQFTGVAVYFTCPQFITPDSMMVKLDDRPFDTIDLTSPTGAAVMSHVLWSVIDLPNTTHRVELLPGMYDGEIGFVSVDAFIVTELDPPRPSATSGSSGSSGSSSSSSKKGKSKSIGIGVGAGLGALVLLLGLLAFFYKKRKNQAGTNGVNPSTIGPPFKQTFFTPAAMGATQPFISPTPTGATQPYNSPTPTGTTPYISPTPTGTTYPSTPYDPNAGYNQPAFNMPDPAMAQYGQPQNPAMLYPAMHSQQPPTPTSMSTTVNPNAPIYV